MEGGFETDDVDDEADANPFEESPLSPTLIGLLGGAFEAVVIAGIGMMVFENVAIAGISGLMVGLGTYLFVPLVLAPGESGDLEELAPPDSDAPLRGFHRLAAGWACGAAGILFFATGFLELEPVVGLPATLTAGVLLYLVLGVALPDAQLPE